MNDIKETIMCLKKDAIVAELNGNDGLSERLRNAADLITKMDTELKKEKT
jgi:hypothetical protein